MQWQYRVVSIGLSKTGDALGMSLSYFGQHGWELVTIYERDVNFGNGVAGVYMVFKRPVPPGTEPEGSFAEVWTLDHVAAALGAMRTQLD